MSENNIQFSLLENKDLANFEERIAYFYGVSNPEPVIEKYIKALGKLEEVGLVNSGIVLEKSMLPYLEEAYHEISRQREGEFDIHRAAWIEYQIILSNAQGASFDSVCDLMINLYTVVFQSNSPYIRKAAMLRTFLYQYKNDVLKREQDISHEDQEIMVAIAKTSERYLNSIT